MERLENCPRVVQLMSRGTMDPLRTSDTSVILLPAPRPNGRVFPVTGFDETQDPLMSAKSF